jgi:hypothetical protein
MISPTRGQLMWATTMLEMSALSAMHWQMKNSCVGSSASMLALFADSL